MEDKLQEAREKIRRADEQIAAQFVRRMEAVRTVAAYKKEHGLPILDRQQEKRVIERNAALIDDAELRAYYVQFQQDAMAVSRQYQHRLMEGMKVAYSGVEGAFAHIAAGRIFPDGDLCAFASFEKAYDAVVAGECDCAVLPIENSYAGEVGQVVDLMFTGSLYVNGVYDLPVTQNLLGIPEATMDGIRTVISHPQALDQCRSYLRRHGFEEVSASNTALAARTVAEKRDVHTAAIASAETAALYGLKVLDHDINESRSNTTRFAVFSRAENRPAAGTDASTFLLLFTVKNVAGALARAVSVIGEHGFNMKVLRSRPMKTLPWEYYFYVEAEGDADSEAGRQMMEELSKQCAMLKVVGRYSTITAGISDENRV